MILFILFVLILEIKINQDWDMSFKLVNDFETRYETKLSDYWLDTKMHSVLQ